MRAGWVDFGMGDHAWVRMPCSGCKACSSRCRKYGCTSIWLTAGRFGFFQQFGQDFGHEVGDADGADQDVGVELFQGPGMRRGCG